MEITSLSLQCHCESYKLIMVEIFTHDHVETRKDKRNGARGSWECIHLCQVPRKGRENEERCIECVRVRERATKKGVTCVYP
jgi:hypothetical protein